MTSLLKRLSLSIERNQGAPSQQPGLVSHPSFNDFSFHIHQDCAEVDATNGAGQVSVREAGGAVERQARQMGSSPFVVGSAPAGLPAMPPHVRTGPLRIPKTSAAHALAHSDSNRSSTLDTPKQMGDMPATPRSPTSPSGRGRRTPRSPKIDGMDYWDYCELLRSSSL